MHIQKLKVRPKKSVHGCYHGLFCARSDRFVGAAVSLCAPELATMLGCWAAKNDTATTGACAESARALYDCMRSTVRAANTSGFAFDHVLCVAANRWETTPTDDQLPPRPSEQGPEIIGGGWTKLGMTTIDHGTSLPCRIIPEYKSTTCGLSHGPPATMSFSPPSSTEQPNPPPPSTASSYEPVGIFWDYGQPIRTLPHLPKLNLRQRTARRPPGPPGTTSSITSAS